MISQRRAVDPLSRADGHGSENPLTPNRVRDAVDSSFQDRGVRVERLLHLGRPDLEAGDIDHVLDSIHERHIAVIVYGPDVATEEPAVPDGTGGVLRPPPVAPHHTRAPNHDLAPPPVLDFEPRFVDDSKLEVLNGVPDRLRPAGGGGGLYGGGGGRGVARAPA